MDITCPHCHQILEGDGSLAGETVICPGCNHDFAIPKLVAVGPAPVALPHVRPIKQSHMGRWFAFGIPVVILLFLGGVLLHNLLRDTVGQHPEDGDLPEVLEAEQLLLMDFYHRHGQPTTDDFLQSHWTENKSNYERHLYVPWLCFMGPEKRIEARINQLAKRFEKEENSYFKIKGYMNAIRGDNGL